MKKIVVSLFLSGCLISASYAQDAKPSKEELKVQKLKTQTNEICTKAGITGDDAKLVDEIATTQMKRKEELKKRKDLTEEQKEAEKKAIENWFRDQFISHLGKEKFEAYKKVKKELYPSTKKVEPAKEQ